MRTATLSKSDARAKERHNTRARAPLTSVAALAEAGLLPGRSLEAAQRVAERYAVAITPAIAALIEPANVQDPIARQFLPDRALSRKSQCDTESQNGGKRRIVVDTSHLRFSKYVLKACLAELILRQPILLGSCQ